jgi:hypothetical protein
MNRLCFWIGFFLYVVSFWLTALNGQHGVLAPESPSIADWAFDAFLAPLIFIHWQSVGTLVEELTIAKVSFFLNGWINPVFLLVVILILIDKTPKLTKVLRYVLLPMIAFCWITLLYQHAFPREGYFFWSIGMLLVLFSSELERRFTKGTLTPRLSIF